VQKTQDINPDFQNHIKIGFEWHPQCAGVILASITGLARDLANIVSEPVFRVSRFVEAARHQLFNPLLCGWSPERSDARIPPGAEFDVRRQAGVDQALSLSDRPLVELGDPGRSASTNASSSASFARERSSVSKQ
jgi:hypothetical protein